MCPTCIRRPPVIKPLKGAASPIMSSAFRDRFQVDLVDMQKEAQEDVRGVACRYIVVLKDHFTRLSYCEAIPRKQPIIVAEVLCRIFGLIGAPKLLHSDNGNEFTSEELIEAVKDLDEDILSVFGRPRKPNDQGSVEIRNKMVKSVLFDIIDEQKRRGKTTSWPMLMGHLMGCINSHEFNALVRTLMKEITWSAEENSERRKCELKKIIEQSVIVDTETRSGTKTADSSIGEDGGRQPPKTETDIRNEARRVACIKRKRNQEIQAEKMVRLRNETLQHVTPGTVVSMKMDPRDVKRARGLLGIVCDRLGNRAGGVQVATEEGIVTADLKKREYFIPSDRYAVQKVQDLALPDKLEVVREEIMNGLFDLGKQKQKHEDSLQLMSNGAAFLQLLFPHLQPFFLEATMLCFDLAGPDLPFLNPTASELSSPKLSASKSPCLKS
ncbi:integrase core domain containing protein [Nitzschia inconspicua]|uniref:Integrase core domain containing protein n=1 Tax=Nitzschia inconspicua TaxID=303405 RepID=A0A9K3KAL6_9STRA|nr:integrase core domain containing protein [Nitzschia inconspicua]